MGNNPPTGIPRLIIKNWLPVTDLPNTFKNRLTGQFAHKHIVVLQDYEQIQSFRIRMKQANQTICRILFYHHYCDNIYHVYTDEMLPCNLPFSKPNNWNHEKLKIIQGFQQLMKKYGCMRICQQMIGMDSSGKAKIWINSNPVAPNPWGKCSTQRQMITDLMICFQHLNGQITQNRSLTNSLVKQYNSFEEVTKQFSANIPVSNSNSCTFVENTTNNFNININIDLNKKKHKNKLQKIFNPVVCETSRNQNQNEYQTSSTKKKLNNSSYVKLKTKEKSLDPKKFKIKKSHHLHRPVTTNCEMYSIPLSYGPNVHSSTAKVSYIHPNTVSQRNNSIRHKRSSSRDVHHHSFKNVFSQNQSKYNLKKQIGRPQTNYHNKSIPTFLLKKNSNEQELPQERAKTQIPQITIHPSTERVDFVDSNNIIGKGSKLFSQYIENFDQIIQRRNIKITDEKTVKLNVSSTLKDELNDLLESDDERVSPQYQQFKQFSLYRQNDDKFNIEKDETELIKEKVEKKKATFADLKMEALKILDDF